jgi:hypothetical protein
MGVDAEREAGEALTSAYDDLDMADDRETQLAELEQRFGARLPEDYRQFIIRTGGVDAFMPPADDYLVLHPPDQLASLDEAGDHQHRFPGGLAIGGDGSREVLFYDFRRDPPPLVLLDITAESWNAAIVQASSLTDFLDRFPEHGWLLGDKDQHA